MQSQRYEGILDAFVVVNKGAKKVKAGRGFVVSFPDSTNRPSAGLVESGNESRGFAGKLIVFPVKHKSSKPRV